MRKLMLIVMIIVTLAFAGCIWYGGKLGDFVETETVGSVMCLSCMGLQ
ncbi:MAG: hypothetical protein JSU64_03355 [candidate division WOR-3 bacterium]|nr:MAG: hypothetical protein JSU64_03355 [candidate division WOR-3 bacterium]